jgi:mono/diheme cytochrome c family protein
MLGLHEHRQGNRTPMPIRPNLARKLIPVALATLVGTAAFAAVVFGGIVNVAATDPHFAPVEWTLQTTMRNSVRWHARGIEVPADVDLHDPALADRAFGHYSVACTSCHGGPGVDPAPWLVLQPPARPLVESTADWSDAELYWIIKHGIKATGMPALGPTHEDADLWAIAAFVRQLPEMSPADYEAMAARHAGHGMHEGPH